MLLPLLIVLAVIGVIWYLLENYVPMPPPMKIIIRVVILLAVLLYILRALRIAIP
jgi:hypothetical protein